MTLLDLCKILTDCNDESLLNALIFKATKEFETYTGKTYDETKHLNVVSDMVNFKYGTYKSAGLSSQSYSGVSESYLNGYDDNIIKQLNSFKQKVMFV